MKKHTKLVLGLLVVLTVVIYSGCKCPACPQQNNIVTDTVDTLSFSIVTDTVDTLSFQIAAPVLVQDGKVKKTSIVVDNVDMARMIREKADTAHFEVIVMPNTSKRDTSLLQQQ